MIVLDISVIIEISVGVIVTVLLISGCTIIILVTLLLRKMKKKLNDSEFYNR